MAADVHDDDGRAVDEDYNGEEPGTREEEAPLIRGRSGAPLTAPHSPKHHRGRRRTSAGRLSSVRVVLLAVAAAAAVAVSSWLCRPWLDRVWALWRPPGSSLLTAVPWASGSGAVDAESAAFWWLEPALSRWTSAAFVHQHLRALADAHGITERTAALPEGLLLPGLDAAPPAASGLSGFPALGALQRVAADSSAPAPSSYYTALLYDSFRSLPFLTGTSALPGPLAMSAAALRHVRLVDGRLKLHLPPAWLLPPPRPPPDTPDDAAQGSEPTPDLPPIPSARRPSDYWYEAEVAADGYEAFEATGWAQRLEAAQRVTMRGLRTWSNSTHWPLPSFQPSYGHSNERRPTPFSSAAEPLSFHSLDGVCHATQTDFPRRSHGRLPYHADPYLMLQQNANALHKLVRQSRTSLLPASDPPVTSLLATALHTLLLSYIPVDVEYGPLDYADPAQCAQVVDHEYILDSKWLSNPWHTFGDWIVPAATLLHDPCFFPLDVPLSALAAPADGHSWYWNSSAYATHNDSAACPSCPLPHARASRPDWVPARDARLLAGGQAADHLLSTEHRWFLSQHRHDDKGSVMFGPLAEGAVLPQVSSVASSRSIPSVCIKDAVVGVPWYFLFPTWTFVSMDADREEWEMYRLSQHLDHMDSALQQWAQQAGQDPLTELRRARMVDLPTFRSLHAAFLAKLRQRGVATDTASLPAGQWIGQDIRPLGWLPPSHEEWLTRHPQYDGSEADDPSLARLRRHRWAGDGPAAPVFAAERGRPFNDAEVDDLLDRIAFHSPAHALHADVQRRFEGKGTPRRLRLLVVDRQRSRFLRHVDAVREAAEAAGFEAVVAEFDALFHLHEWRARIEFVRGFDVVLAVHGAGLVNLVHMLPNAALLVELFPECWCHNDPGRSMYGGRLAHHAQVRSLVLGVPCPRNDNAAECFNKDDEALRRRGVFVDRADYASRDEVRGTFSAVFSHVHHHFLTLPSCEIRETTAPVVQMRKD